MESPAPFTRAELLATRYATDTEMFAAHRRFYAQFVTASTIATVAAVIGRDKLLASTDRYFNDIPLRLWDAMCGFTGSGRRIAGLPCLPCADRFAELGDQPSLGSYVCIAKEAGRQIVEFERRMPVASVGDSEVVAQRKDTQR